MQRQQHHHPPGGLPPPAVQIAPQLLGLTAWTFGEHTDRAHTDHDLAGRMDDGGNLDPTSGEANVNALHPPVSHGTRCRFGYRAAGTSGNPRALPAIAD
jgi:hypothetical protein